MPTIGFVILWEEVERAALGDDIVRRHLGGAEVRKVIHVPDRLINLVAR